MNTNRNLSQGRIEHLEEIGFQWQVLVDYDEAFEEHIREVIVFKEEVGHCNVPQRYAVNPSLGNWCNGMRKAYNKIQKGMMTPNSNLSQDRIERLEEIGFQWQVSHDYDQKIEKRCHELIAF